MKTLQLFEDLQFREKNAYPQPLNIDASGRVLRFALRPGQTIHEHNPPDAPFYLVVLEGRGAFAGKDGREEEFGAGTLLIFDPGEHHVIRARERDLILLGFMRTAQV
jgi:quercetin dioxygenase-like cupin family protein